MKRITIVGYLDSYTGYGQLTQEAVKQLQKADYFVTIRKTGFSEAFGSRVPFWLKALFVAGPQLEDWEIAIQSVNYRCTPHKKTMLFTMWEATQLPHGAVNLMNLAEVVCVPNQWNAACFSAAGVTRPIRIIPLGIDPSVYHYHMNANAFDGAFTFGCAGRWFHGAERKGINETVMLFLQAFPDNPDVRLECKIFADCPVPNVGDSRVIFHRVFWSDAEMADWYKRLDCFISLATAEGWGLHQQQSMAIGRPLISPKYAGVAEFFDDRGGYVVRHKLVPVPQPNRFRYLGDWSQCDPESVIECMISAYKDRSLAELKGRQAAELAGRFTWDNMGKEMLRVMKEFGA